MFIYNSIFYLFAASIVFSALMVITVRNPVHSVLFLILAFFNSAGLFILRGAEFLAMTLVIVYVGAVAVLFLFVVMMLDIQIDDVKRKISRYSIIGIGMGLFLLLELILAVTGRTSVSAVQPYEFGLTDNTRAIGILLYREFAYLFEAIGMILLVAMVGAIVLTLRRRPGVKRQDIHVQNRRSTDQSVTLQDPVKDKRKNK